MNSTVTEFKLRCTRCGCDQFKLTAHQLDAGGVGDIDTECTRCGWREAPGYLPDVDGQQLEPSRDPAPASSPG